MDMKLDLKMDDVLINKKLDLITKLLLKILRKEEEIMATLDETLAIVTELPTLGESVSALLVQLKTMLAEALAAELTPAAQAKVDAVFAGLQAHKTQIADALIANTPVAP